MSEDWVSENIFCPCCGHLHLSHQRNNTPVGDFLCENCCEEFELKSKRGVLGAKIVDGAYSTMINRITSLTNPNLLVLNYTNELSVKGILFIPKFFFVPGIIEKRKPLSANARRANWVGCNILIKDIPKQGIIPIIEYQQERNHLDILKDYNVVKSLQTANIENRGWLFDVLNFVNFINQEIFTLRDVYEYAPQLQTKHPDNHNIEAKIRQQLQILRDKGLIEFLGNGIYQKITHNIFEF